MKHVEKVMGDSWDGEPEGAQKTVGEYLEALGRRKAYIIGPFLLISLLAFVLAMKLPAVYRSSGTILIEDQQIPRSMVETTITDFADKRIELIKQRVMTRDRILSVIEKHKLYLDVRDQLVPSELVKRFQEDVEIKLIAADVVDPQRGAGKATIAFTISFSDRQPALAQAVANELVSLFLNENTRTRAQRAAKTTEFLNEEAEKLKGEIATIENKLAEYKAEHGKSLPELLQSNVAALDRATEALRETEKDIRLAKDRMAFLSDSQIQEQEHAYSSQPVERAGQPLSTEEQIRRLRATYTEVSARYTATHPDVLRIRSQLEALDPKFSGDTDAADLRAELVKAEADLTRLRNKYSGTHPDVVREQQHFDSLKQKLSELPPTSSAAELEELTKANPTLLSLASQIRTTQHELESATKRREELEREISSLQSQVTRTPQVEMRYIELQRDRQNSLNKYAELEHKTREAKLAQTLEEEQKGESFTLIEPPVAPDKPEKPDRKKIIMLGAGLGFGSGLGLALLLEQLNAVIRGSKSLERVIGSSPLVIIPYIETPMDVRRHRLRIRMTAAIVLVIFLASVGLIHALVIPLEKVWSTVLIKVSRL